MIDILRKTMDAGVGVLSLTKEKLEKVMNELVEKGEVTKDEAKDFVKEMMEKGEQEREALRNTVQKEVERVKGAMGLISRDDLRQLEERLKRIEDKLDGNKNGTGI